MVHDNLIDGCLPGQHNTAHKVQIVLAIVPDHCFGSWSWSKLHHCLIGCLGQEYSRTHDSDTVQWNSPKQSELEVFWKGYPVDLSLDPCNALLLPFQHSMLSKSLIQCTINSLCMFCSLRQWLFWNLRFSFYLLYVWLWKRSRALIWTQVSVQCLDYWICKTKNCWHSVDAHCHDGVK